MAVGPANNGIWVAAVPTVGRKPETVGSSPPITPWKELPAAADLLGNNFWMKPRKSMSELLDMLAVVG